MLDETKRQAIVNSFRLVVPIAETAADLFYKRLFELRSEYRDLFPPEMDKQKRKLVTMLAFIVKSLDFKDNQWRERVDEQQDLFYVMLALGRRHTELYRVPAESYGVVGEALLWTLEKGLGDAFTSEVKTAWTEVYQSIAVTMQMGVRSEIDLHRGEVA